MEGFKIGTEGKSSIAIIETDKYTSLCIQVSHSSSKDLAADWVPKYPSETYKKENALRI